jgi:hypothetical protein
MLNGEADVVRVAGRSLEYLWIPLSVALFFGLWMNQTGGLATGVALGASVAIAVGLALWNPLSE